MIDFNDKQRHLIDLYDYIQWFIDEHECDARFDDSIKPLHPTAKKYLRNTSKQLMMLHQKMNIIDRFMNGIDDDMDIDHINGNGLDNRLENLRLVSRQENAKNRKITKNIKHGVFGISFCKPLNKWRAMIKNNNVLEHIGYFDTKDDAVEARKSKEKEYGFHSNHGRLK